eukprot:gb/GECH01012467.1/.p1 GENE.gb/GECH01012467.1/~~gb/GECH01012467.1/.p1  ORF type:complete len:527 (+),score=131.48 gb/GECH01012467.1/:1-1581(+)
MEVSFVNTASIQLPRHHYHYHNIHYNHHNRHHHPHRFLPDNMYSLSHDSLLLAVATPSTVSIVRVPPQGAATSVTDVNQIEHVCSREEETITCIKWIFDRSRPVRSGMSLRRHQQFSPDPVLAVGTSWGYVKLYTAQGSMLHEQLFHNTPVRRFRIRVASPLTAFSQEDLTVIYPDQIIVVDTVSLRPFLSHKTQHRTQDTTADPSSISDATFEYKKYAFGSEDFVDAICCGPVEDSVFAVYHAAATRQFIAVGTDHMLSTFTVAANAGTPLSAAAIATNVASKVSSAMYSFAKSFIWGGDSHDTVDPSSSSSSGLSSSSLVSSVSKESSSIKDENTTPHASNIDHKTEPAIDLAPEVELTDPRRRMESIGPDPTGRYAAATDSLGRIMIVDLHSMIIIRMLKGYRSAQCAWIVSPPSESSETSLASHVSSGGLFLVVLSPVRRVIEVWDVGHWQRIGSITAALGSDNGEDAVRGCLLQETVTLIGDHPSSTKKQYSENTFPCSCLLLRNDGNMYRISVSSSNKDE